MTATHTPRERSTPTGSERWFSALLVALVASLVVQGAVPDGDLQQIAVSALVGATLLISLRAGDARPSVIAVAAAATTLLVIGTTIAAAAGEGRTAYVGAANAMLVGLAPPAIVLGIARALKRHDRIPVAAVLGVLCLYLLFGMFCAFLWQLLDRFDQPFFAAGEPGTSSNFVYFSYTTLTTVGYGDLTARTPLGHTLSALEALIGQIYLVTVVSLFVTNVGHVRSRSA